METEALSSRELLTRLEREYQVVMGRTTLRMELKRLRYVWKCTRYSLKKRDPQAFEQAWVEIDDLIQQARAGEIELAYVDEAGFAPQPPNRSFWSKVGATHTVVLKRSQCLNVIGALLSSGRLMMVKLWQSVNGLWFFGFLMTLIDRVKKPMVVILDSASIHTAKALEPHCELLKEKGLRFYFLPAYSP